MRQGNLSPSRLRRRARRVEAAALLAATRLALVASPRRIAAGLLRHASVADHSRQGAPVERAREVAADVESVAPFVSGSTCLSRALVAWVMLRRRGLPAVVRLGARREAGSTLSMHAWLEIEGAPLIGSAEAADFVALR